MSVLPSTKFVSTRAHGKRKSIFFFDAVFQGLAEDGGLFIPTEFVDLYPLIKSFPVEMSFLEMTTTLTQELFSEELSPLEAKKICTSAFNFEPTIKVLDDSIMLLELFNGPSYAFKDYGASYLASMMQMRLRNTRKKITILIATSGDTGSAVAQAFHLKKHINVVILYPSKRVSPLQEKQLTTVGDNVFALEVQGSFDDCQQLVKDAFLDDILRASFNLSSANSINIGRLIPQVFYYIYLWHTLMYNAKGKKGKSDWLFCTPSGNFGNLTAGLLAKNWGLPIKHIIAACNDNKVVPNYLKTGIFHPEPSKETLANAMDVGNPSNFERMLAMCKQQIVRRKQKTNLSFYEDQVKDVDIHREMNKILYGFSVNDTQIKLEINRVYKQHKEFICPHTAVGTSVARQTLQSNFAQANGYKKVVVLSTAHPGKFSEVIKGSCGKTPPIPECLQIVCDKPSRSYPIKPVLDSLAEKLDEFC